MYQTPDKLAQDVHLEGMPLGSRGGVRIEHEFPVDGTYHFSVRGNFALARNPQRRLPPHWWDGVADPALPAIDLVAPGRRADRPLRHALSQSFAFGGSNAALVFGAG